MVANLKHAMLVCLGFPMQSMIPTGMTSAAKCHPGWKLELLELDSILDIGYVGAVHDHLADYAL